MLLQQIGPFKCKEDDELTGGTMNVDGDGNVNTGKVIHTLSALIMIF